MKKYLCLIGVLGILLCNTANSYAQKVAVKTNLLYGLSIYPEIIIPGSLMMKRACATGAYSRNFATGFVRNSTVIFWVCTDITPNTMWAECHF